METLAAFVIVIFVALARLTMLRRRVLPPGLDPLAERPEKVERVVRACLYADAGARRRQTRAPRGARRGGRARR
jgi:hypothetical protein